MRKRIFTFIGTSLIFLVLAAQGLYAQSRDCNAPSNVSVYANHYPDWYSTGISWDGPATGWTPAPTTSSAIFYIRWVGFQNIAVKQLTTFDNPTTFKEFGTITQDVQAMEYGNGLIYLVTTAYFNGKAVYALSYIDHATGIQYYINSDLPNVSSMAWNPVTNELYATVWGNEHYSGYGKIDALTGEYTQLGTVPGMFTIAFDNSGVCYAVKIGNPTKFGTINISNGTFTEIASYSEATNSKQGLKVDRETNKLYWGKLLQGAKGNTVLYEMNKATGQHEATISLLGSNANMSTFAFAFMGKIDENAPKYNIYRDGTKLNNAPMGTKFFRDLAPAGGTYNYCVTAVYGDPVCESAQACAAPFVIADKDNCPVVSLPIIEGFNKYVSPPYCWTSTSPSNTFWGQTSQPGVSPACTAQEGVGMAEFRSFSFNSGSKGVLATPAFNPENKNQVLSFWLYRNAVDVAKDDRVSIYLNSENKVPDGMEPIAKVHRSIALAPVTEKTGWYQHYVELPCSSMEKAYVIFEACGDFGGNLYMDNVVIGDICVPVARVSASLYGTGATPNHAHVTWKRPIAAPSSLTGYDVYRNGTRIASNVNALEYKDESALAVGTYTYSVAAVYDNDCGASEQVSAASVMISSQCADAAAPAGLRAKVHADDWYDVDLVWEDPMVKELSYCKPDLYSAVGAQSGGVGVFTYAIRFLPEDLDRLNGVPLKTVRFAPFAELCDYTIKVWQGGTSLESPGTLIMEEQLKTPMLALREWNEITLTTPVVIDASKELRIGVMCEVESGYPASRDEGPVTRPGYSDALLWTDGAWTNMNAFGTSCNWLLEAFIKMSDGTEKSLGYNVYQDDVLLNKEGFLMEPTYRVRTSGPGTYTYQVSTLYDNICESKERAEVTVVMPQSPCDTPISSLSEGFEQGAFPPQCWDNISDAAAYWERIEGMGIIPMVMPIEGNAMLQLNSWWLTFGKKSMFVTPEFEAGRGYKISFWIARTGSYATTPDRVNLYLNDVKDVAGLTPLLTVHRSTALEPVVEGDNWYQYEVEVNTANMSAAYFIFEGVGHRGGDLYIDDIRIEPLPCDAVTNLNVTIAQEMPCGAVLTWDAPTFGQVYNVYRDNVLIASGVSEPTFTDTDIVPGRTYEWSVTVLCGTAESDAVSVSGVCTPVYVIKATAGDNGTVSPLGEVEVIYGENKKFDAIPDLGYAVDEIFIDGVLNPTAVEMDGFIFRNVTAAHTIHVTFKPSEYTIKASAGTGGSISPSGNVGTFFGDTKIFTITPETGYYVTKVLIDGVENTEAIGNGTYTFHVTGDHTIQAFFAIHSYSITASAGEGGVVTPNGTMTLNYGSSQSYAFYANAGYEISRVLIDGANDEAAVAAKGHKFTNVAANHTIHIEFRQMPVITSSAGEGGNIVPNGIKLVNYGGEQLYTFVANPGYEVSKVLVNGANNTTAVSAGAYTFSNVTADGVISVEFSLKSYTITASAGTGGAISPSGANAVVHGGQQEFVITPNAGYEIANVLVDGASVGKQIGYTFNNVTKEHNIRAEFKLKSYTILATAGLGGSISPAGSEAVEHGSNQTFTITANDGYEVADVVVDGTSVGAQTTYTFDNVTENHTIAAVFSVVVGIEDVEATLLNAYPNPVSDYLNIESSQVIQNIKVFDIEGKQMHEMNSVNNTKAVINVSGFANGIYFIHADGNVIKVIKK